MMRPNPEDIDEALTAVELETAMPHPVEADMDWHQRYMDQCEENGRYQFAVAFQERRWRRALRFMGVQMVIIAGFVLLEAWRWWR